MSNLQDTATSRDEATNDITVRKTATRLLVGLLRVYTSFNHVRGYVTGHSGERIPLVWPRGYYFTFATLSDIPECTEEMIIRWDSMLCCKENLILIAFVADTEREWRLGDTLLLMGQGGRVYATDLTRPDMICRVGDTIDGFIKRGLRRWTPMYDIIGELAFRVSSPAAEEFVALKNRQELLNFATKARADGLVLDLIWPGKDTIAFNDRVETAHVSVADNAGWAVRRMTCFATAGLACFGGAGRYYLYVDTVGRIYMFEDLMRQLYLLAEDVPSFMRVGTKQYYKSYMFYLRPLEWQRRPVCPHTAEFARKTARDACFDLLLSQYKKRRYGRNNYRDPHQ